MRSLCLCLLLSPLLTAAEPDGWKLVWQDEFDGPEIDFSKWAVEENGHGGGNDELQYYLDRRENVRTANGHLIIQARREKINVAGVLRDFSSARIRTKRRASWLYGRFEIRARLPEGQGLWSAIWMLPEDRRYGGWAASGEIDIVETIGHQPDRAYGTLHYGGEWPNNKHSGTFHSLTDSSIGKAFHVYAVEWEAGEIRWYVDGKLYQTQKQWSSTAAPYPAPFNQPFHLIINLAVGGKWPGAPDATTTFPAQLEVDYVRVYQRAPAAAPESAPAQ